MTERQGPRPEAVSELVATSAGQVRSFRSCFPEFLIIRPTASAGMLVLRIFDLGLRKSGKRYGRHLEETLYESGRQLQGFPRVLRQSRLADRVGAGAV